MHKGFAIFVAVAGFSTLASAESWEVTQGEGSRALKGQWSVNVAGGLVSGTGTLSGPGVQPITFKVGGQSKDGMLMVQRTGQGVSPCTYVAQDRAPAFAGSANCGGQKTLWHVVRTR